MNTNELTSAIEAILFAYGEPLSIEKLSGILVLDADTVEALLNGLSDKLAARKSGLKLVRLNNSYQLCSDEKYAEYVKAALDIRRKTPLSPAAFEVLSVIAYNQPVTKAFVEQVRGVDCSGVVTTLCEKQLIEEKGRLELPGRPLLYGTTDNFLRCFGISSLSELPPLPKEQQQEDSAEQISLNDLDIKQQASDGLNI